MNWLLQLLCLIQHRRIDLDLHSSHATGNNSDSTFFMVPFWHNRLGANTCTAVIAANNPLQGRLRGQAFGISDPLKNYASTVGARFTFNFIIDPEQVTAGALHRFMVEIRTDGEFEHFAAVPFSGDDRRPPAQTLATQRTFIDITEIDFSNPTRPRVLNVAEGGIVMRFGDTFVDSTDGSHTDMSQVVVPTNRVIRTMTGERVHLGQKFRPSGLHPVRVRVRRDITAQAVGCFSDIQIRGDRVASMRTQVLQMYFQKVLEPGSICFAVLNQ